MIKNRFITLYATKNRFITLGQNADNDISQDIAETRWIVGPLFIVVDTDSSAKVDWLQSFKQFFINVQFHILEVSLTLIALF